MTNVECNMEDCIHRSKVPMRKFIKNNGSKCYKCTLDLISIRNEAEQDAYDLLGKELPCCNKYERKED